MFDGRFRRSNVLFLCFLLVCFLSSHRRVFTVELRNGEMYRGRLVEAEDNMSCQLSGIVLTGKDGKVTSLEQVYVLYFIFFSTTVASPLNL